MNCFKCIHDDCINDCKSEKQYRYNHSEKGREARRRYTNSEKGQANEKRKRDKKIASGKNAEYCRRYYARKKQKKCKSLNRS
jgi:hypothetical protein